MNNIKVCLVCLAVFILQAVIIVTPALAVETPQIMPWGTVILPPMKVTPCKVRKLDQGSGSVRICSGLAES